MINSTGIGKWKMSHSIGIENLKMSLSIGTGKMNQKPYYIQIFLRGEVILTVHKKMWLLEGKRYKNNFQERDFLRDLKIPPVFPCYVAAEKRRELQIT